MGLTLSPLIADGMVLQQGQAIPLRVQAAAGTLVTALFLGKRYSTVTGLHGKGQITLEPAAAGGPFVMEISSVDNTIIIQDICIGDVWLCSGQSNMELPMQRLKDDFPSEWAPPVNSLIRQFKVPQEWDFSGPRDDLRGGAWVTASPETLHEFSGTAWFFARALFEKHHTPIGIINAAWGGTPAEAWMSRGGLSAFPEKITSREHYDTACRESEAAIAAWNHELIPDSPYTEESYMGISLPGDFSANGIKDFYGSIWLRREFEADAAFAAGEAQLRLGTITDSDTVYVNDIEVGNTGYRYPPRKYHIPPGVLHPGKNIIVIRIICRNGDGGITMDKNFCIFSGKDTIELGGTWEYRIGSRLTRPCPEAFFIQRQPMGLFNAMIAPVTHYPCRGVLWYQGESNDSHPGEYAALLPALINDWRCAFSRRDFSHDAIDGPELPFLIVQLPIFGEPEDNNESSSWAVIREAQCSALALPATGMAAGLDLGEWNDLHPINKKDIGRRLALAAEKVVYKENNTSPGPLLQGIEQKDGRLILRFDNCGGGLMSAETPYVSIIANKTIVRTAAEIAGADTLTVDISVVENPEKILYAWANNPRDRQLFNSDGLPMIPFCIYI